MATSPDDPALWAQIIEQHRADDETAAGLEVFARVRSAAANDPALALLGAQLALDGGLDAVDAFVAAIRLDPQAEAPRLGLAAALIAQGRADAADELIERALFAQPGWVEGQTYLAKLRHMRGDPGFARGFDAAIAKLPENASLWQHRIALEMHRGHHETALALIASAEAATGPIQLWTAHRAACHDELGDGATAAALFAALDPPQDVGMAIRLVRHQLRRREPLAAWHTAEPWLASAEAASLWPYVSLAWRLLDDPRHGWLEGDPRLVGVYDIGAELGDLAPLTTRLRQLHRMSQAPIDQSLRDGTQTDGYLLARLEPEFGQLRRALATAVAAHIAQLPPRDPFHPVLKQRRDAPVRVAGSWSVRLRGGGHHESHVHPLGWFSSALYLTVPPADAATPRAGWLKIGQPDSSLGLDLDPLREIEPKPGRLILFPSTMWHGTHPTLAGERLTVAFDVAPPR